MVWVDWSVSVNDMYIYAGIRGYFLLLLIKRGLFQIKVLLTLCCIRSVRPILPYSSEIWIHMSTTTSHALHGEQLFILLLLHFHISHLHTRDIYIYSLIFDDDTWLIQLFIFQLSGKEWQQILEVGSYSQSSLVHFLKSYLS